MPRATSELLSRRFIPKPDLARALSLGFDRILSDYYWLVFAQYYGDKDAGIDKFRYAPDYLRLIVSLDPHFIRPYWFTAFVLAGDMATQARMDNDRQQSKKCLDESKALLDDGIRQNPNDWTLPYIAGFSQYLFAKDDKCAAHYYKIAAKVPGAPAFLPKMARIMESGVALRVNVEARTWTLAYLMSNDREVKNRARRELQIIWSQIYYLAVDAKLDNIVERALSRLKDLDVTLLPQSSLPQTRVTPAPKELLQVGTP